MTAEPDGTRKVSEMMHAAFVPETKRLSDLLREFRQSRLQLAIAVDDMAGRPSRDRRGRVEELVGDSRRIRQRCRAHRP
jgi:Mg2+/Co2+ transporter CorC